jgi:hypothetical protein
VQQVEASGVEGAAAALLAVRPLHVRWNLQQILFINFGRNFGGKKTNHGQTQILAGKNKSG